jgi:broad specificity phosphatase PhoE
MTTLYLISHAHTAQQPTVDAALWRLSPRGVEQAAILAEQPFWAEVSLVVVSEEAKTYLTAQPAVERWQLPLMVEARFNELKRPGWVGDYEGHVRSAFARPEASIGGWEAAQTALQRFLAGVAALPPIPDGRAVALVSHGLVLSLYRAKLLAQPYVEFVDWKRLGFAAVARTNLTTRSLDCDFAAVAGEAPRRGA